MDKIIRNVMVFAATIILVAAALVFFTLYKPSSAVASVSTNSLTGANVGNTAGNNAGISPASGEVQNVRLSVSGGNYILTPSVLKLNVPVKMEADMSTVKGCAWSVVISAFGVRKYLTESDNIITFTPTQTGTINIACSMNMYRGAFTVVDASEDGSVTASATASNNVPAQSGTSANLAGTPTCGMSGSSGGCGCGG